MLIHRLSLEDVKSYAQTTVEFTPGTNAIVGRNGSGKTTILEAIGFALFDYLPYSQADFVREGQKTARVAVDFLSSFDGRTYQAARRCGSSSAYTILDPETNLKLCEGKADVSQFLRQHLGVDPAADMSELFKNAVGVPQGSFTAAFLESPTSRKGIFDPLLRVAEYRRAFENLRQPLSLLNDRRNEQAVIISGLEGQLSRLPGLQTEADELTDRIANGQADLTAARAELKSAQTARQALEAQREELLELRRAVQLHQQTVAGQERTLDAARQRLAETEQAVQVAAENRPGHDAYQQALQAQRALNERLGQRRRLEEQQTAVSQQLSRAESQLAAQETALAEIAEAEKSAAALAPQVAEQENLESALREAQRQADRLQDAESRLQRERRAVAASEERLARLRADVSQAQAIEAELPPLQQRLEALQQQMAAAQAQAAQIAAEQTAVAEQVSHLQAIETATCPVCEQPLTPTHRQDLLQRNQSRLEELRQNAEATRQAQALARSQQEKTRATISQQEQALRALPRVDAVAAGEEELAALRQALAEAQAQAAELADAPAQAESLQAALAELDDPRRRRDVALARAAQRGQAEEALDTAQAECATLREESAAFAQKLQAFAGLDEEAAQISAALDEHQSADDLYRRHQAAADALPRHQQEAADAAEALQTAQSLLAAAQEELQKSEQEFDEQQFHQAVARVEEAQGRMVRLEADVAHWQERLSQAQAEIGQLQAQAQQLARAQASHSHLTEQAELLQVLRGVLQEAGPYVTKALVQQISYAANQLFGEIMEDFTRPLHWTEEYEICLEVDGRQRSFSQLSGGEQMTAALAVRLALLQEMSDIAVAFFDEPTTNLDEARRVSLARQILAIQGFEQLFVISHDDTFEQATENLIRVQKSGGVSKIASDAAE